MPTQARAVYAPPGEPHLGVEQITIPDPGPDQVVVKLFSSGICHSQLHHLDAPRQHARLLGHEGTGVVTAAGARVDHVREGDHVIVTWVPRNEQAAAATPEGVTLTFANGALATTPLSFTWADVTISHGAYVVPVPKDLPTDVSCILGCAVITGAGAVRNTAAVRRGQSVAVFGIGGVGLSALAAARVVGAEPIIAVDLSDEKLHLARRFGATETVNAAREDPVARIKQLTPHPHEINMSNAPADGVDYAFDCIGVRATMEQIGPAVRGHQLGATSGGTAVLVGVPTGPFSMDATDLLINEKKYIASVGGSCRPERDFPTFIRWFQDGDLDLNALVTHRYRLDQINDATDALRNGRILGRAIIEF